MRKAIILTKRPFDETGAGPVSFDINRPLFNEAQGFASLRIGRNVPLGGGWGLLRPVLDVGYPRELDACGDDRHPVRRRARNVRKGCARPTLRE